MEKVHDEPLVVSTERGVVLIDGPAGIALALTPEAAIRTADLLLVRGRAARNVTSAV